MAYFALPTRDSTFLLLANAAPRLPRSSCVAASSSCSLVEASRARPLRVHSQSLFGASLSSNFNPRGRRSFASVEGNVSVEEPAVSVGSEESADAEEKAPETAAVAEEAEPSGAPAKQFQRTNTLQRQAGGVKAAREVTVTMEQLVPGAVFTGKIRAVQSYGAFVDIGAFTDGLVHISQLSSGYVKEVSDVVTLGQEVSVTVVELNEKSRRIALSMREKESEGEQQASTRSGGESGARSGSREDGSGKPMNRGKIAGRGSPRPNSRSNEEKKATKLKKGQELKGTVKNIIRNGAFVEFAEEGEEGFLRGSEITEGGENVAVDSLLTVGQEVTVRVLKIERGKAALTMKPQVDVTSINDSINPNVGAGGAANPFATFFRSANLIPASSASVDAEVATPAVEELSAVQEAAVVEDTPAVEETPAVAEVSAVQEAPVVEDTPAVEETPSLEETPAVDETVAVVETPSLDERAPVAEAMVGEGRAAAPESAIVEEPALVIENPTGNEAAAVVESPAVEDPYPVEDAPAVEEPTAVAETAAVEEPCAIEGLAVEEPAGMVESAALDDPAPVEAPAVEEPAAIAGTLAVEEPAPVEEALAVEEPAAVAEAPAVEEPAPVTETSVSEGSPAFDDTPSTAAVQTEAPALEERSGESSQTEEPHSLSLGEIAEGIGSAVQDIEKVVEAAVDVVKDNLPNGEETPALEEPKAAAVEVPKAAAAASGPTAAQVKALREKSGAGMMECKKALVACENDLEKASEYLRKKGLASADKKASRIAAEGRVGSYVHDGRIGVLIEVNCETDFVSRGTQFKELVADMGMQVVACPDVKYVSVDDVPGDFVAKEKEIEMGKEDLGNKPAQIREKIVEGRIAKRLAELALLEQAYIRDDKVLVKDHVKETIAKLGEKIQVRRFVRFNLGEGLQKKSVDFAAEVAAQTAAKVEEKAPAEAPKVEEAKKEEEGPKVAVSAATVKQLREVTGAGMMDCKKALAACENDVGKATEYLRKKGLASADKKSGRIASEGLIGSYIHDGRIGVLVEVNSETDFVARSKEFKELVANIGMQVAACPQVQYVTVEEIPASFVEKEKEIEAGKEDLAKRPEAIRAKIVEGRVAKTLNELVLLEQPYIRDDKILVKDYVKQAIAALGENIQVRRFERFNLGEGIEKRSTDFAAEVAAQTGAKA